MVAILRERLAIPYPNGRIIRSMGRELSVRLASTTRGRISFRLELYVNLFDYRPEAYSLIHANLSMIFRSVSSYPLSLINMFISVGLLYIHSRPEAVSVPGWNPPFRAYTAAIWVFFTSNVFLVVVPFIPPAPGYKVFERIPYYVSKLRDSRIRV